MGIPKGYVLTKEQIEILKNFADAPLDDGPQGSGPTDPPTPIPVPRTNPPTPTPVPSPSHPFDLAPHEPELVAPTIPGFKPTKDRTKNFMGFGGGGPAEHRELLQDLSQGDQIRLLLANNILPRQPKGGETEAVWEMPAFLVNSDLQPAGNNAALVRSISFKTPLVGRTDHAAFSYKSFESNLQTHAVIKTELEFGIPEIFKATTSYSDSSAQATNEKKVKIFSEASQLIPKAWLNISVDDVTPDPTFVKKIQQLSGTKLEQVEQLLDILDVWGHFVPLNMLMGGRLTFYTSTELNDKSEFSTVKREFKAAAKARFTIEGVPVQGEWGSGVETGSTNATQIAIQAKSLFMEVKGGDENLVQTTPSGVDGKKWKTGTTAATWVGSLGRYREWRVVGFYQKSLVPIIQLLPPVLRDQCMDLLREYFVSKLSIQQSASAGHEHGKDLVKDSKAPDPHIVRRITDIEVRYGGCLDRMRVTYDVYNPGEKTTKPFQTNWVGSDTGKSEHIKLKLDEEITAIETWTDPTREGGLVQQVAFRTSGGRRFPDIGKGFYGENRGRKKDEFKTIEAPRVRGITGSNGAYIHRIGLKYAALDANAKSREYLLAMEPFLFPDKNYGIIPER